MGVAERIAAESGRRRGPVCSVSRFLAGLDQQQDRVDFEAAFDDDDTKAAAIHRVMKDMGYPHSRSPVERHKNDDCSCGRS